MLGLPTDEPIPPYPRVERAAIAPSASAPAPSKRKAPDEAPDEPASAPAPPADPTKRSKTGAADSAEEATPHARAAAFIPFLTPEELAPPKLPSREELEGALLALRKRGLLEDYFGEDGAAQ